MSVFQLQAGGRVFPQQPAHLTCISPPVCCSSPMSAHAYVGVTDAFTDHEEHPPDLPLYLGLAALGLNLARGAVAPEPALSRRHDQPGGQLLLGPA